MALPQSLIQLYGDDIPDHQMVMIENRTEEPFTLKWGQARYVCPAGMRIPVPWPAMVRHLGDPRTINIPGGGPSRAYRAKEFQRICDKYGIYTNHNEFPEKVPNVKAFTLDGEPIITVLDDPMGNLDNPERVAAEAHVRNEQSMRVMEQQIAALQAQLMALQGGAPAESFSPVLATPAPQTFPVDASTTARQIVDPATGAATPQPIADVPLRPSAPGDPANPDVTEDTPTTAPQKKRPVTVE